jgi:pimeloyl-ACP methyl ester carboxylesterase
LVLVPPFVSHIEHYWEDPLVSRFLTRLASFSRLILFDKRGTRLSDRAPPDRLPTLEQRMDDVRAVLDVAGSQRAARTRGRSAWPSWRPPPAISTSSIWPTRSGPSWGPRRPGC